LVRQARQGDRDAFDVLLTEVVDHLYRIARLTLRDFDSAEDAVQEALVKCWRDLP
jgi:DNA-directed RNA polymerase specialized sigma24 family protein